MVYAHLSGPVHPRPEPLSSGGSSVRIGCTRAEPPHLSNCALLPRRPPYLLPVRLESSGLSHPLLTTCVADRPLRVRRIRALPMPTPKVDWYLKAESRAQFPGT